MQDHPKYGDPNTMDLPEWCSPMFDMHYCPGRCGELIPFEAQLCARYYCTAGLGSWVGYVKHHDCSPWKYPSLRMSLGFVLVLLLRRHPKLSQILPLTASLDHILDCVYPWELGFTPEQRPSS